VPAGCWGAGSAAKAASDCGLHAAVMTGPTAIPPSPGPAAQLEARSFSIDGEAVMGRAHKVGRLSALVSERQSGAKYLYRVKHEFSVEAAFYVGSPPEAMLLACKKEVADSVAIAP
jgi:hypothetical protein